MTFSGAQPPFCPPANFFLLSYKTHTNIRILKHTIMEACSTGNHTSTVKTRFRYNIAVAEIIGCNVI